MGWKISCLYKLFGLIMIFLISGQIVLLSNGDTVLFSSETATFVFKPSALLQEEVDHEMDQRSYIVLKVIGNHMENTLKIIVNGDTSISFRHDTAYIPIQPQDALWVDARGIDDPILVQIHNILGKAPPFFPGQEFWIHDEVKFLGDIWSDGRL